MPTRRYAVFGLLDDDAVPVVRSLQQRLSGITGNDLALRFPVHVTLRGRFRADPEVVSRAWDEFGLQAGDRHRFVLSGPVFRPPDLLWLEVTPESPGHAQLVRWHAETTRLLEPVVLEDETTLDHTGAGYRPHVTLGWGGSSDLLAGRGGVARTLLTTSVSAVVLAEYPTNWPASGVVLPVRRLQLVGRASESDTPETSC